MRKDRFETLKAILDTGRYTVDLQTGVVYSEKYMNVKGRRQALKPEVTDKGYHIVTLWADGKPNRFRVHQIVAVAGGLNLIDLDVNHIDSIKSNNSFVNLEAVTPAENNRHAVESGNGGGRTRAVSKDDAHDVRRLYASGKFTHEQLGKLFGVSGMTICNVVNFKTVYAKDKPRQTVLKPRWKRNGQKRKYG